MSEQLTDLCRRFSGLDIEYRRDWKHYRKWTGPWRMRLIANKNERCDYRITVYGESFSDADANLVQAAETARSSWTDCGGAVGEVVF